MSVILTALLLAIPAARAEQYNANVRCANVYVAASTSLKLADTAIARRDYRKAGTYLDQGLDRLGSAYNNPPILDDTGMSLILAEGDVRKGNYRRAAATKRSVLAERLEICRRPVSR